MRGTVLAGALIVGGLLAGCAGGTAERAAPGSDSHLPTAPISPAPISPAPISPARRPPHLAAASAEAEALLALMPLLPGGRRLSDVPGGVSAAQSRLPVPVGTVARSAWFTAAGSVGQAMAFLRGHVPIGLTLAPAHPGPVDNAVHYIAPASTDYTSADLTVVLVAAGHQLAAHAESLVAAVGGTGATGALGTVPTDVSAVDVEVTRQRPSATTARTLVGRPAASLAATVNTLEQLPPGIVSCLADSGARDVLTLHTSVGVFVVTVKPDPCGTVKVVHDGLAQVLSGAAALDRAVLAALGLATAGH